MYGTSGINSSFFTLKVIGPILTLSILCSCLCFVLWIGVIKNLGITRANTLSALIPAVSAIGAAYLGEESLSTIKWIGIGITIIGVILAQKNNTLPQTRYKNKIIDFIIIC
jgi:EamA-like transporter family.